ncbi:hypothetical protein E3N88_22328 [Mikania micrantha]|uniref:Uncharacterized protein n=1 Tax=Mikania micrantha TaxID=192012 RepID=A0A5N6NBR8_9ASTR|nr:hypothetical protein E3N88_22328 [Mikania micrantha]
MRDVVGEERFSSLLEVLGEERSRRSNTSATYFPINLEMSTNILHEDLGPYGLNVLELPYLPSNKYWSYHTFPVTHTGATILTPEQPYLPSNKYWSYHAYPVSRTGATMLTQYHVLELPYLPHNAYMGATSYPSCNKYRNNYTYPVTSTGATIIHHDMLC